jgi:glyoxylase I family protein
MIRGIHHVAVHVHDLDRMIRFYRDAFGFEVVGEPFAWEKSAFIDRIVDVPDSAAKGAMLRCGTCYMELFEYQQPRPTSTEPKNAYDKGYTHFCVDVTDIEQEFERLKKLGMSFGRRPCEDHLRPRSRRQPDRDPADHRGQVRFSVECADGRSNAPMNSRALHIPSPACGRGLGRGPRAARNRWLYAACAGALSRKRDRGYEP